MDKFTACRACQQIADTYSKHVETKPCNAYPERPVNDANLLFHQMPDPICFATSGQQE